MQGMGDWLNSRRHFPAGLLPLITAVCLLLLFPAVSPGAALTWVGTGADSDFRTQANWSPALIPSINDTCTINSTSNRQPTISANASCGSLTLGTGATVMTLTITAGNNLTINGDVLIGSNGRIAPSGTPTGTFSVNGNWSDDLTVTNFTSPNLQLTYVFDGASKTISTNESFYDISFQGSTSLASDLTIANSLSIANGKTFTQGAHTIIFNGSTFTASGTYNHTCSSTIAVNGTFLPAGGVQYPNVTINSGGSMTSNGTTIACDLTLQAGGTATFSNNTLIGGRWINNGATINTGGSVITMSGPSSQITGTTPSTFYNLTLGDGAGDSTLGLINLMVNNDLNVTAGATFTLQGGLNITVGNNTFIDGTMNLSGTSTIYHSGGSGNGITVRAGGLINAQGTDNVNRVTFDHTAGLHYYLKVYGSINFNNVNVYHTLSAGANSGFLIASSASDTVSLSNMTMNYTENVNRSAMIYWDTNKNITASNVTFTSATYSSLDPDVNVEARQGSITFTNYRGNYAGEPLDNDNGGLAIWVPGYQADGMIKLSTEADTAYLTNDIYELSASVQSKSQSVLNGSTAIYTIRFQNDGSGADNLTITGTGSGSGFTVQYLDNTATDRTAAVTGAGYTINGLAADATRTWTLRVTPTISVTGGSAYTVLVTATPAGDTTKKDQVKATTTSTSANLTFLKSANKAAFNPGEEIAYTMTATSIAGLTDASNIVISDPIPANTGFKIGGAIFNAGTSTLTSIISYSNNNGTTWVYTPVSSGCAAPANYDYCVTNVKWTMSGAMPSGTNFSSGLVVRVK